MRLQLWSAGEGDGWVDWSGLATSLGNIGAAFAERLEPILRSKSLTPPAAAAYAK
jgi:hypothetical protein